VGRPGADGTLRSEIELKIKHGQCAYCRKPAAPDQPLTREHVIPLARGGKRRDARIIVPACARCNHRRGCQELVLFLLLRPRRISAFIDYLATLSSESIRQVDLRVFAELYAAVWMLNECLGRGGEWRSELRRLSSGRTLHRRRYAARRVVGAAGGRLETLRERGVHQGGPSCLLPAEPHTPLRSHLDEPLGQLTSRMLSLLSLAWQVSAEDVQREISRQMRQADPVPAGGEEADRTILRMDGWRPKTRRRRLRTDRRGGRGASIRGRAA
jgi:hypothetical protein